LRKKKLIGYFSSLLAYFLLSPIYTIFSKKNGNIIGFCSDYFGGNIKYLYEEMMTYKGIRIFFVTGNKKELERVFRGTLRSIRYHLKKEAIQLPPGMKAINIMLAFFKEHKPIIRFLHKRGNHLEMQNKDSQIMERILERMAEKGVLVLPIHDSLVTPKSKMAITKRIMIEVYQQVLGTKFKPVLKVSGLG